MKRYIRAYKNCPGTGCAKIPTNNPERLIRKSRLRYDDQLEYKRIFKQVFKTAPFYFDDVELVDEKTSKTIHGVYLDRTSWQDFTKCIIKHFNIPVPTKVQAIWDEIEQNEYIYML